MNRGISRIIRIRHLICFVILSLLFLLSGNPAFSEESEADGFSVKRIGQMICYRENTFSVQAPEDGIISVVIYDETCQYRIIRAEVRKGISEIRWDGCGYNGERLDAKYYYFDFSLTGISGKEYSFSFRSPIVENAQHLQFVLPSGDTAYLSDPAEWFVEIKAVRDGSVIAELVPEDDRPVRTSEKTVHMGRVEHFTLEGLFGRTLPDEGEYSVNIYEASRPDEKASFPLRIASGFPEEIPVSITGEIMPSDDADDHEIWEAMMKPSVVVDIEPTDHQKVYALPDSSSECLGTLHGQTQGVSVLQMDGAWAKVGAWNHEEADYVEGFVPVERLKVLRPNPEYGLLVDKKKQTLTVYRKGEKIETLLVSTGRMDPGKFDRETSAGCFLTGLHRVDFSTQGLKYDFVIQYDGGNLLHQIPYSSDGRRDFTQGKAYLGTKASHACIRVQDVPGKQNGINAYWLWTHLPYRTRIIILDDPEERAFEKARLSGGEPVEYADSVLCRTDEPENGILLTFAGDVIPVYSESRDGFDAYFRNEGAAYPFSGLTELFSRDDLTCVSLGCVLRDSYFGEDPYRKAVRRGIPSYAEIFGKGSVELVSLGDDHLFDYGQEGYDTTASVLDNIVPWSGRGHSRIVEIRGCRFGFATIIQQDFLADTEIIKREILSLRDAGCDYVIVQCHWGEENNPLHNKLQEAMARACALEGADLVVGRHPDQVQGIGDINGMPVIWSLGRLVFDHSVKGKTFDTLAVQAVFDPEKADAKPLIRLIPLLSSGSASEGINDCRPVPAEKEDAQRIMNAVQRDTGFRISQE